MIDVCLTSVAIFFLWNFINVNFWGVVECWFEWALCKLFLLSQGSFLLKSIFPALHLLYAILVQVFYTSIIGHLFWSFVDLGFEIDLFLCLWFPFLRKKSPFGTGIWVPHQCNHRSFEIVEVEIGINLIHLQENWFQKHYIWGWQQLYTDLIGRDSSILIRVQRIKNCPDSLIDQIFIVGLRVKTGCTWMRSCKV